MSCMNKHKVLLYGNPYKGQLQFNQSDFAAKYYSAGKMHLFCIFSGLEVDKGKTPGASRLLVIHNADITQRAKLGEDLPQVSLCGVQAQAKHSQAAVWVWVCLKMKKT